ncbi:DinB family protein [Alicyclobacillus dauci]|uniref:DinB family protein n=1 Tax=Alicyclobacillus dauci TaxID=1475485 RepID=A0ABY6Z0Y2_9BACL|nr:DinB family protein [Alicyclobacillus dauci]WAH36021.1 DinB family protein [Alicyclobacillus dauci]
MLTLFKYNWQVRDEWFDWCGQVPFEELIRTRIGGVGSILHTLFHVVDAEGSWIGALAGKPDPKPNFEDYMNVDKLRNLSHAFRDEVKPFLAHWTSALEDKTISVDWNPGDVFTYGEVARHVIAHEIHHVGQLSVWSRELGLQPVSANLIGRNL